MGFDVEHGCSLNLVLLDNVTTTFSQTSVDTSNGSLGTLDLTQVHRLQESGYSRQDTSVHHTTASREDLASTTMDRISVQGNILDVNSDSTHVLLTKDTLVRGPLESRHD